MGTGADVVKDGPIFLRIVPAITSSAPPIPEQGAHSYLSFYFPGSLITSLLLSLVQIYRF